ncbi:hypothetical protein C8Q76DRAFT_717922 [Earliella scabrosa]|nr:hypothetical protein C8Q76DRAFT_717922 [Earliella scabrosa]
MTSQKQQKKLPLVAERTRLEDSAADPPPSRREYVRCRVLHDHIERSLRKPSSSKILPQSLALASLVHYASRDDDEDRRLPGGVTTTDLSEVAPVPPPVLSPRACQQLEGELKQTLFSISDYYTEETAAEDDDERLERALDLHEQIRSRHKSILQKEASLEDTRSRVLALIDSINKARPTLESKLLEALTDLPPQLYASRAAQADVVAATIETALLKLSLVRARAYGALYGHTPPDQPDLTVSRAVGAAYEKLKERQRAQETEMDRLDRQIEEYEGMLRLVDGRDGSFAQVVKDMARVKRETEECRRDLRRLGWTGD